MQPIQGSATGQINFEDLKTWGVNGLVMLAGMALTYLTTIDTVNLGFWNVIVFAAVTSFVDLARQYLANRSGKVIVPTPLARIRGVLPETKR